MFSSEVHRNLSHELTTESTEHGSRENKRETQTSDAQQTQNNDLLKNVNSIADYNSLLQTRLEQSTVFNIHTIIEELKSLTWKPTNETFRILLKHCLQSKNWKATEDLVKHFSFESLDLFILAFEIFLKTEHFDKILLLLSRAQNVQPPSEFPQLIEAVLNTIISENISITSDPTYSVIIEAWKCIAYKRRKKGFSLEALANFVEFCMQLWQKRTMESNSLSLNFDN
jgi:hypothetical protein